MSSARDTDEDTTKQQINMNICLPSISSDSQGGENKDETVTNKIKPLIPAKPGMNKPIKPPPIKRKPLTKSQSVDLYSPNKKTEVDLTQVGDSEWKDFVLKRRESGDEEELTPAIRSLNLHRQSLSGTEQTIVEDQVLHYVHNISKIADMKEPSMSETVDKKTVNQEVKDATVTTPTYVECKKSEVLNSNSISKEPEKNITDINDDVFSSVVNGECKHASESNGVNGVDSTNKDNTEKTEGTTAPFMLPKPRQIMSEIKRKSFATSRSMSLPATHLAPQIKRSSDILREASAQTPYFCRLSRGSVDLLDSPGLSSLSLKEESDNSINDNSEI